jgi:hypothetical protein
MPKQLTHKDVLPRQAYESAETGAGFESGDEATAKLAYQLWLQRGRPDGSPEEDWYRAQDLLRAGEGVLARSQH